AFAFVAKPIQKREVLDNALSSLLSFARRTERNLLVIEPNAKRRKQIQKQLEADDIHVKTTANGNQAVQMLKEQQVDCLVISPLAQGVTDSLLSYQDSLDSIFKRLPVIVYGDG